MKKILFYVFAVILFAAAAKAQTQKIGYVDSQVILNQLPAAVKAQSDIDAFTNEWSAHLDSMRTKYQNDLASYQQQSTTMTESAKLAEQKKLVNEENEILNYNKEKFAQGTGEIYKKQDEIFGPVKAKIYKAINTVAKREDMKFVFDKAGDVVLLYADPQYDITYKVLDLLKTGGK